MASADRRRLRTERRHAARLASTRFGFATASGSDDNTNYIQPSFEANLTHSLVPTFAAGSSTPTFTRATTAYVQDFEGLQKQVLSGEARFTGARRVYNVLADASEVGYRESEDVSGFATAVDGTGSLVGRTAGQTDTPNSSYATSTLVEMTRADTTSAVLIYALYTTTQALLFKTSLWFKAFSAASVGKIITVYQHDGTAKNRFNITLTANWVRYSTSGTTTLDAGATRQVAVFGYIDAATSTGTAKFYVTGVQPEIVTGQTNTNPSDYVSIGVASAPYHGANVDGVKYFPYQNGNTVASNIVTENIGDAITAATLLGYQAEGARADVLGTTAAIRRTMTDVGWVVGATMTVGSATGIDGVASAGASLTGGAVEATNTILFTTVLASAARTFSVWARRKTGTGTVRMTDNGGTNWTDITLTTTYTQFQVTRTQANPIVGFQIATDLDAIEVDFNTIEAASFANPTPIPVNVSKAADVLTYTTSGNLNGTVGTAYSEINTSRGSTAGEVHFYLVSDTIPAGRALIHYDNNELLVSDGATSIAASPSFTISANVATKYAVNWSGTTVNIAKNGIARPGNAAFDGDLNISVTMSVGIRSADSTGAIFGAIKNIKIWPVALPAATLTNIT